MNVSGGALFCLPQSLMNCQSWCALPRLWIWKICYISSLLHQEGSRCNQRFSRPIPAWNAVMASKHSFVGSEGLFEVWKSYISPLQHCPQVEPSLILHQPLLWKYELAQNWSWFQAKVIRQLFLFLPWTAKAKSLIFLGQGTVKIQP